MLLGVVFVGVAIGRLVAAIGQPLAYGIPGFPKLVEHDLEAPYGIFTTGEVHLPKLSFGFGILIDGDAGALSHLFHI